MKSLHKSILIQLSYLERGEVTKVWGHSIGKVSSGLSNVVPDRHSVKRAMTLVPLHSRSLRQPPIMHATGAHS